MSLDLATLLGGSPKQQASYWEGKLDLLLRLEAEALVERLGVHRAEPHEFCSAHPRVLQK